MDELTGEARQRLEQARHEAWLARNQGRVRLWELSTRGLERAHELLDEAPPMTRPLRDLVDEQLARSKTPPVPDYAQLNARSACKAIRGLDLVDLERVDRFERDHKDRKTVHDAVAHRREQLQVGPQHVA